MQKYLKYLYPAGLILLGTAIGYAIVGFLIPNTWYYASVYQEIPLVETKVMPVEVITQIPILSVQVEKAITEVPVVSTKLQIVEKVVEVPVYREVIKEVFIYKGTPLIEKPLNQCEPYGQWKKHNP